MMNSWEFGAFGWVSMILMLALLVFVVVGIVVLIRGLGGSSGSTPQVRREEPRPEAPRRAAALDVLEERYARGELDREEFLQCKKDLTV